MIEKLGKTLLVMILISFIVVFATALGTFIICAIAEARKAF